MQLSWLPNTFSGRMVADYVATVFPAGGRAFPIYALALAATGSTFHQAIFTSDYGYTQDEMLEPPVSSAGEQPIPGISRRPSDAGARRPGQHPTEPHEAGYKVNSRSMQTKPPRPTGRGGFRFAQRSSRGIRRARLLEEIVVPTRRP